MKTNWITSCALTLAISLFSGCEKSAPEAAGGDAELVVAAVEGRQLTMREVSARANNIALLVAHRDGNLNRMEKIRSTFVRGYAERWVEDTVLAAEAVRAQVEPGEDRLATCR